MITNERQYQVTKKEAEKFEQALIQVEEKAAHLSPRLRQAMREGLESQLQDLREDLAAFEALRSGRAHQLELDSLSALPEALIQARIAAGLTQEALAKRLGLKKQQIQRYEATRYAGASLARVQAVADALGVKIRQRVLLPTGSPMPPPADLLAPNTGTGTLSPSKGSHAGE